MAESRSFPGDFSDGLVCVVDGLSEVISQGSYSENPSSGSYQPAILDFCSGMKDNGSGFFRFFDAADRESLLVCAGISILQS